MGRLSTGLIAALSAVLALSGAAAQAEQGAEQALHPVLGKKPPREVLNKDLLALPERERQAWIHGAMAQMAQTLAAYDQKNSRCILFYYFEDKDGLSATKLWMEKFPDKAATITLGAVARQACPIS